MSLREELHRVVDDLLESELATAKRFLVYLCLTGRDALLRTLLDASEDDEEETPEEAAAVGEACKAVARGDVFTLDDVRGELGL